MMADALGVELDEVVCEAEYAAALEDLDLGSWQIEKGCVAGIAASWQGRVGGRTVVELNVRWKKAPVLEPDWTITDGWGVGVAGRPTVRTTVQFLPPPDFVLTGHPGAARPASEPGRPGRRFEFSAMVDPDAKYSNRGGGAFEVALVETPSCPPTRGLREKRCTFERLA